ncbi:hypothetical protein UPYG_G00220470 [Umbra pygmaea]|uniref:Protein TALPID3 n=1 Tax=Umbra pygmaea TaxID=75934 RepID=A0ABD0WBF5_UMBPY
MSHNLLSRSNELSNFATNINLDESTASSDAGDVLIRATRMNFPETRGFGSVSNKTNRPDTVKITVGKLRDVAQSDLLEEPPKIEKERQTSKQEHRPALRENLSPALPLDLTKICTMCPRKSVQQKTSQVLRKYGTERESSDQPRGNKDKGHDLLISRYSAGGKGTVLAALKQRSQTASLRQKVKVQLLGQTPALSMETPPAPVLAGDQGAASTAAFVTAAAIAATAPLIKAQSDMEVRVSQVSEELRRLLQSDRYQGKAEETRDSERVTQLEAQLHSLTQQRLQHLEWIQSQQMALQNHLLGSALSVGSAPSMLNTRSVEPAIQERPATADPPSHLYITHLDVAHTPSVVMGTTSSDPPSQWRGEGTSTLETPAPRRLIPKPTRWNTSITRSNQDRPKKHNIPYPAPGNGRLPVAIPNNSSLATESMQRSPARVAIATPADDCQQPAQSRESQHLQEAVGDHSGVREPASAALMEHNNTKHQGRDKGGHQPGLPSPPGGPEPPKAVKRATDMLQDLGRLKTEMQALLQAGGGFSAADRGETLREKASAQTSDATGNKQPSIPTATPPPPPCVSMEAADVVVPEFKPPAKPRPTLRLQSQPSPSMFEDAERVLRQVQRHKKTLEENLQAMLRARDGETLHSQLDALSCNRDTREEVRIKRTVDAWINTLGKEVQADIAMEHIVGQKRVKDKLKEPVAASLLQVTDRGTKKNPPNSTSSLRDVKGRSQTSGPPKGTKPHQRASRPTLASENRDNKHTYTTVPNVKLQASQCGEMQYDQESEEYWVRLYGKALYEGHRRTLKKGPYLRFTSPSPKSKAPRPRLVESVRGVKLKSSKTQTTLHRGQPIPSPQGPGVSREPQYIFSPTRGGGRDDTGSPMEGYLIPMAIPLGQPRVDGFAPQPSCVFISDRPVMVTTSQPPSTFRPDPAPRKPNMAILEVKSAQRRRKPQLQVQVQPSVNIEPPTPCPSMSPSAPPPAAPPTHRQGDEGKQEEQRGDEEAEDDGFPGTHYLEVADITQDAGESEELPDGLIELNGLASPPAAMYHGPVFPCYPADPRPHADPVLSSIQDRETLENRLVDWVEQQLMARMISEMYHPPVPDPAQDKSPSHSEPDDSITSDIVEAAGGAGLQLFVDASVPVDSELIRHYVNEALAETIALMLGQREGADTPVAPARPQRPSPQEEALVPTLVPTPMPTPMPTPEPTLDPGPPSIDLSPLATPHPSGQGTPEPSTKAEHPPPTPAEPVATPVTTPVPPAVVLSPTFDPAGPWADASLPLDAEQPHSQAGDQEDHKPLVMSVAEEEPVCVLSPVPPGRPHTPAPTQTPSCSSSSSSSSSESSSSSTVTGTDTAARHISEGELLLTRTQGPQVLEEGCYVPYIINSFSSSLHELQDMDYDPPSEGQVRSHVVPSHHDPVLALLAKMDQGLIPRTRPDPEGSWEEDEEDMSEGQRPRLHPAGEGLLTGRSRTTQSRTRAAATTECQPSSRQGLVSSPGQLPLQATDAVDPASFQDSWQPVDPQNLEIKTMIPSHLHSDTSMSPPQLKNSISHSALQPAELALLPRPSPILVKQFQQTDGETPEKPAQQGQQGSRVVAVRLPSIDQEEQEEVEEESVSLGLSTTGGGAGDTDSSGNDMF